MSNTAKGQETMVGVALFGILSLMLVVGFGGGCSSGSDVGDDDDEEVVFNPADDEGDDENSNGDDDADDDNSDDDADDDFFSDDDNGGDDASDDDDDDFIDDDATDDDDTTGCNSSPYLLCVFEANQNLGSCEADGPDISQPDCLYYYNLWNCAVQWQTELSICDISNNCLSELAGHQCQKQCAQQAVNCLKPLFTCDDARAEDCHIELDEWSPDGCIFSCWSH